MIEGSGTHGLGFEAQKPFGLMLFWGGGRELLCLVNEGREVYSFMKCMFGIQSSLDHYSCIADLLGRYGKLKNALALILKMVIFLMVGFGVLFLRLVEFMKT